MDTLIHEIGKLSESGITFSFDEVAKKHGFKSFKDAVGQYKKKFKVRINVEQAKNQVQAIMGAISMTDRLVVLSKEGNYSKASANSEGVDPEEAPVVQKSFYLELFTVKSTKIIQSSVKP